MKDTSRDPKLYSEAGIKEKTSLLIGTCFFAGYLPLAPGTWASALAALAVYFLIPTGGIFFLFLCVLVLAAGVVAAGNLEKYDGIHDNPRVVIDEAAGFMIAVAFVPKTLAVFMVAFFIFRVFDIWKPPPIGYIDVKVKGGLGVMLDDVVAGIFTNIVVRVLAAFVL